MLILDVAKSSAAACVTFELFTTALNSKQHRRKNALLNSLMGCLVPVCVPSIIFYELL